MSFNVDTFRKQLRDDGARPNLFEVYIPFVNGLQDFSLKFMCKAAQIPGSNMGLIEVPYFGRTVKVAGNRTYDDWTVTVMNDENFTLRKKFEEWHNVLNSHVGNKRDPNYRSNTRYGQDAIVKHYRKTGGVARTYNIIGLWPTNVAPIDLDWGSNDTIEEFTVTFAYQYWQTAEESKSTAPEVAPSNQERPPSNAAPAGPTADTTQDGNLAAPAEGFGLSGGV